MKKIVIVEDFNTSRQIIKRALEKMGLEVLEASDGREALKYFDGSQVDLLISDYNMPHMDGAELIEYIRNKIEYKYIPIIMLSTETYIKKQNRAKEAKITAWVRKPFQIDEFTRIIEKALR
jgi:two-component system, chemotaxis family, chemotaxis protein CheY